MNNLVFDKVNLTFIKSQKEVSFQIRNTLLMKYVYEKYSNLKELEELLIKTQYGFTASASSFGKYKLLRISDLKNNTVDWEKVPYCDGKCDKYLISEGDVVVARTGNNKSYLIKNPPLNAIYASYLIRLNVDKVKLLSEYLYLFLNSYVYWNQVLDLQSGSVLVNVNAQKMKKLKIPYCSIDIQRKIINMFYYNEKKFEEFKNLESNILLLSKKNLNIFEYQKYNNENDLLVKKLRQSILREAVQGKLVPQDSNDEPAYVLLEKIKKEKERLIKEKEIRKEKNSPSTSQKEIPFELPKGWEWTRLGHIANYGHVEKIDSKDIKESTWLLDLEDIEKETSKLLTKKTFKDNPSKSSKNIFVQGDVLYGKLRPYLDKVLVAEEAGVCTTEIVPIRPYLINPYYLRWYLKNPNFIKHVNSLTYGVKMPRLGTTDAERSLIPLPPLNEQKRIVQKVDKLMKLCGELEKQVKVNQKNSELLMDAVLREAFELQ